VACENSRNRRPVWRCAIVVAWALSLAPPATAPSLSAQNPDSSSSMKIGQAAPNWSTQGWVNAVALDIKQLRGKVVLLRFLSDSTSSAATLVDLYRTYRVQGMAVVGMYAPSPMPAEISRDHVREFAASQGFEFPIGVDSRWETLNRYWIEEPNVDLVAATFLIDRKGIIRYIQPDGQYEKNSANRALRREYEKLQKAIEALLKSDDTKAGGVE
jgi:peroxiredoxin